MADYFTNYDLVYEDKIVKQRSQACFGSLNTSNVKRIDLFVPLKYTSEGNRINSKDGYIYQIDKELLKKYILYLSKFMDFIKLIEKPVEILNNCNAYTIEFTLDNKFRTNHKACLFVLTILRYTYETGGHCSGSFDRVIENFVNLCENIENVDYHKLLMVAEQSIESAIGNGHDAGNMQMKNHIFIPITWKQRLDKVIEYSQVQSGTNDCEKTYTSDAPNKLNKLIEDKNWEEIIKLYKLK